MARRCARPMSHASISSPTSPWFAGPYFPRVTDRPIAQDLLRVLRTGKPARFASRPDEDDWHQAMETETFAEEFLAAMDVRGRITGHALAPEPARQDATAAARHRRRFRHLRMLDGGAGVPGLRASVLEKPPVDAVARRAIARARIRRPRRRRRQRHAPGSAARGLRHAPLLERAARLGRGRRASTPARVSARRCRQVARSSSTTRS